MKKLLMFVKNEFVLCIAALLAVVTMFFVKPSAEYISYVDLRTLALLFCLMSVVAGWKKAGVFSWIAGVMLRRMKNTRELVFLLWALCFGLSMFITNDVALITFVPFAILLLERANHRELILYTIVLQTIAANLGSMLLPIGNPQNLYLYGLSQMSMGAFILYMLPLWVISLAGLVIATLPVKQYAILSENEDKKEDNKKPRKRTALYVILFILCLLTVANVVPYYITFGVVLLAVVAIDRTILLEVDYLLLLTFVCFFVFVGNVKAIPQIYEWLCALVKGRELWVGILSSQVISNVPAAILLSGFTEKIHLLIWATDIGGLGTLIASLASLISYKIYAKTPEHQSGKYLLIFTGMNLAFLALLITTAIILQAFLLQ